MKNQKMLRRALLAAAVSTVTSLPAGATAVAADNTTKPATAATGKMPVHAASHNAGPVSGELNRLFEEGGQEMPSMRQQDLPNARNMQSHLVRQKPAAPAPKKNVFQKFIGKITGRDKKEAEAAVVPPVPPTHREPAAVPPASGGVAAGVRQPAGNSVPGRFQPQVPAGQTPSLAERPGKPLPIRNLSAPTPSVRTGAGTSAVAGKAALAPAVPGAAVHVTEAPAGHSGLNGIQNAKKRFVQPGAAPSFMSAAASKASEIAAPAAAAATAVEQSFVDPFEGKEAADPSDPLEMEESGERLKEMPAEAAAQAKASVNALAAEADAVVEESMENPFTGVGLDDIAETAQQAGDTLEGMKGDLSDRELFGEIAEKAAEKATDAAADLLPGKVPELEDFSSELPAISIPSPEPEAGGVAVPSEPLQSIDGERLRIAREQEERQLQLERILARADQTGFKGFCPVALRDHRQLVDADQNIKAEFGLQTYTFSTQEARAAFEASPTRYAPVAGGMDVVAEATEGVQKSGKLDYALWYRERLYLFQSRETMAAFHQNPRKFAAAE
jgi:YHS domain-containing protein